MFINKSIFFSISYNPIFLLTLITLFVQIHIYTLYTRACVYYLYIHSHYVFSIRLETCEKSVFLLLLQPKLGCKKSSKKFLSAAKNRTVTYSNTSLKLNSPPCKGNLSGRVQCGVTFYQCLAFRQMSNKKRAYFLWAKSIIIQDKVCDR